ncbi:hypothetical protein INR49_010575 [Caranx melampygus]|nr:hypothetical protein INR49_010575 [Caranx melampygus]
MRPPVEVSVFLLSLLAPGVLYAMNNITALQEPLPILGMGMVVLGSVLLVLLLTVPYKKKVDPLFYVFAEFSFTCMVGLTNALEQDGFISGFMGFYLKMITEEQKRGLLSRPLDLLLSLLLVGAMALSVFRGFVVLDCPMDACFTYIYQYEPYLKDPVGFPRVMMLVHLFYALPLLTVLIYGLRTPGCSWMLDWTIFLAGAMAQTQWCHIGASLHSRTPFTYRVPADKWWAVITLNVLLAAAPALLALRCYISPAYFMKPVPTGQSNNEKKKNIHTKPPQPYIRKLTLCADDPGSLPAPISPAASGGDVTLVEALRALVAHHGMDVIM